MEEFPLFYYSVWKFKDNILRSPLCPKCLDTVSTDKDADGSSEAEEVASSNDVAQQSAVEPIQRVGFATVNLTVAAIVNLYQDQVNLSCNNFPHPR
jgi:hypothetical protein